MQEIEVLNETLQIFKSGFTLQLGTLEMDWDLGEPEQTCNLLQNKRIEIVVMSYKNDKDSVKVFFGLYMLRFIRFTLFIITSSPYYL